MAVHDQFLHLAATAISDELSPRDAFSLANHVESCSDCRAAETELTADHLRLRALVGVQPVSATTRTAVLDAVHERRVVTPWRVMLAAAVLLLGLLGAVLLAGSPTRTDVPEEFQGAWTTTNCATFWEYRRPLLVACDRWGDGTTLRLDVAADGGTAVRATSDGVTTCAGRASDESTQVPPSPGAGTFLLIRFDQAACGLIGIGDDMTIDVYRDEGGDELWLDDDGDGWGLKWHRSR